VLITVSDPDKDAIVPVAKQFAAIDFRIIATEGTWAHLQKKGIPAEKIFKLHEGRPNILDAIKNKEIHLVINTPIGRRGVTDDSYIRKAAIQYKIPYITTVAAAAASVKGIAARKAGPITVRSLQSYHAEIR